VYRSDEQRISESIEYLDPLKKKEVADELEAYYYKEKWGVAPSECNVQDCNILEPLVELTVQVIALLANTIVDAGEGAYLLYKYIKKYKTIK
jgi:hypothetical protein